MIDLKDILLQSVSEKRKFSEALEEIRNNQLILAEKIQRLKEQLKSIK